MKKGIVILSAILFLVQMVTASERRTVYQEWGAKSSSYLDFGNYTGGVTDHIKGSFQVPPGLKLVNNEIAEYYNSNISLYNHIGEQLETTDYKLL